MLSSSESGFPRLGQMILDYENPLKKLMEEFTTHAQVTSMNCEEESSY